MTTPSPPKPVPALHGSLSLPYARNPSGTDSILNDPHQGYLSQVWGIKTKSQTSGLPPTSPMNHDSITNQYDPVKRSRNNERHTFQPGSKENRPAPLAGPLPASLQHMDTDTSRPAVVNDPHLSIGRKIPRSGRTRGDHLSPTMQVSPPMHAGPGLRAETMTPVESGSGHVTAPTRLGSSKNTPRAISSDARLYHQASQNDPVICALAFQSKLLSPDPKPRQSTPPQPPARSVSASHVIDGYGPPQPPTVSPISAERKAAMAAAERKKRLETGSPGRRSLSTSIVGSPQKSTLPRGQNAVQFSSTNASPMRPNGAKNASRSPSGEAVFTPGSWASRTTHAHDLNTHHQPKHTLHDPSATRDDSTPPAKVRYSPKRGQWITGRQHSNDHEQLDTRHPTTTPLPMSDSTTSTSAAVNRLWRYVSAPKVDQPARNPYDFRFLQPLPASIASQSKPQAGLGLGHPKFAARRPRMPGTTSINAKATNRSRLASDEIESLAGAFPTLFVSGKNPVIKDRGDKQLSTPAVSRHSLAASALTFDNSLANPFLDSDTHDPNRPRPEAGRRVVSEPIHNGANVTTGFAEFIGSSRIVSDPIPRFGPRQVATKKSRKRNNRSHKGFPNPEPVVHNWSSLQEKFHLPVPPVASTSTSGNSSNVGKTNTVIAQSPTETNPIVPKDATATCVTPDQQSLDVPAKTKTDLGHDRMTSDVPLTKARPGVKQRDVSPHQTSAARELKEFKQTAVSRPSHEDFTTRNADRKTTTERTHLGEPSRPETWTRGRKNNDKPRSGPGWTHLNRTVGTHRDFGSKYDVSSTGHSLT